VVFDADNPYQSPSTPERGLLLERTLRPGARGRLLAKGLLYRRVLLEMPVEAMLEFHGRSLRDIIFVDGQIVSWKFSWWRITPYFRFPLSAGDRTLDVEVDLHLGMFLRMKGFRVRVDGVPAYEEGSFRAATDQLRQSAAQAETDAIAGPVADERARGTLEHAGS